MSANLLVLTNIRKFFGPEPVLNGVQLELRQGEKVGLIGPNGVGKTTLLEILAGELEPDGGSVWRRPELRIGYMPQQPQFASDRTVWEEARQGLQEVLAKADEAERLAREMAQTTDAQEQSRLARRYDSLHQQLLQEGGYQVDHRVEQVLDGLGFSRDAYDQPADRLSGGQQSRLLLAQLLLAAPDLLLLDEPSNHLDLPATQWLEEYLAGSGQALVVVSHDRYLLDRVTGHTLELFDGTVDRYRGNFSAYWRQKAQRLEVQQREYDKQQEEIARLEDFIRRNRYGQKHAQAEDRRKKLARIERVGRPRRIAAPPMRFPEPSRSGDIVLRLHRLSKSFQAPLFERLDAQIERGEKWGIFGRNGTGKTTLLRCIVGQIEPDEGRIDRGTGVRIGYFDQRLEQLDEDLPVVDAIRTRDCPLDEPGRRHLLARFGITGDMAFQPVRTLSGGERNRVALAALVITRPNLLVLDEPTNHLDLWARDALETALREFPGTVLLVSHDRYFLNRVVDHLLVLDERPARIVHGNYQDFQDYQAVQRAEPSAPTAPAPASAAARGPGKDAATRRRRQFPYRKVDAIEADIAECEGQVAALQLRLADPDVVRDPEKIKAIQAQIAECQRQLTALYDHWEEAVELN